MNELIPEKELMKKLNVSRSTLLRQRKKGLPHTRIGKAIRYDELEVKKWLEENKN